METRPIPRASWFAAASFWVAVIALGYRVFFTCRCHVQVAPAYIGGTAVILGLIGLGQMWCRRGFGRAEWVLAVVGIGLGGVATWTTVPAYIRQQNEYSQPRCLNNLKMISSAMDLYVQDWDGRPPPPANWNEVCADALGRLPRKMTTSTRRDLSIYLRCVRRKEIDKPGVPTYAMNAHVVGIDLLEIANPDEVPMFFESRPGRNLVGGPGLLPDPPRHKGSHDVLFCDGHVAACSTEGMHSLSWQPKMKGTGKDE